MYKKYIKRILDIALSLVGLIVLSPIILLISFIIKYSLKMPIIFKQKRIGLKGKIFTIYKFATMLELKEKNGKNLPDSKRLTSFGRFLRNYSLDEIPELINIIKGDMSIVGPRPLIIRYMPYFTEEEEKRHLVRPGLTGIAQIRGRNILKWEDRLKLDVKYIEKITFIEDLKIILKTIKKVLIKEGVVIRDKNKLKDFDEERREKIKVKRLELKDIEFNSSKIKIYLNQLQRISNIKRMRTEEIYNNMLLYTLDESAKIYGAFNTMKNKQNQLIGFIGFYKIEKEKLHINYFFIEEKYRQNGIGKMLINKVYDYAKKNNINEIELNVYVKNLSAIKFYELQGFEGEERIKLCKKII